MKQRRGEERRRSFLHNRYRATGSIYLRLDRGLREDFKWVCASHNWTMTRAICYYMREAVRGNWPEIIEAPQRKRTGNCLLFLRGVNYNLRDAFKAWCAARGKSMVQAIEGYMKDAVKKGKPCQYL